MSERYSIGSMPQTHNTANIEESAPLPLASPRTDDLQAALDEFAVAFDIIDPTGPSGASVSPGGYIRWELAIRALRAALASQPVPRGQEAEEALYSVNTLYEQGEEVPGLHVNGRKGTYRDLWDLIELNAALRGQVREGIDVERSLIEAVRTFVQARGIERTYAEHALRVALLHFNAADKAAQGLSGGEGE